MDKREVGELAKKKPAKKKNTVLRKVVRTLSARTPQRVKNVVQRAAQTLAPPERVEVHFVKKTLGKAPEEYHFVLHDGRKLKSLYELIDELESMSEDAFREYVGDFKNDFANWARDIFHAPDLAEELHHVKNRIDAQRAVMKHLLRDAQKALSPFIEAHKEQHKQPHHKGGKCVIH